MSLKRVPYQQPSYTISSFKGVFWYNTQPSLLRLMKHKAVAEPQG